MTFTLSREQLLADLYQAYYDARRHKRNKTYQLRFEAYLEDNLQTLCDALYSRTYKPYPSTCFIITDPKKREVFAADFRDRIVHHLYYNYTHELYERTFIYDTYSCIRKRGTHFGIKRLEKHIRQESQHYTVPCYVMKMDISGYFMHINRQRLLGICLATLERMSKHRVLKYVSTTWQEVLDMDFVRYLTREIVLLNPIENCRMHGSEEEWADLPQSKSLFHSPVGCGLPIGNLTSQLFSNVYLNVLDQYVKRELKCRHYGRYVDDFYVVSADRDYLLAIAECIKEMLKTHLDLDVNDGKTKVLSIWRGVDFLGAYVKPYRQYASRQMVVRMRKKIIHLPCDNTDRVYASLQSYKGLLSHGRNYNLWKQVVASYNGAPSVPLGVVRPLCC